MTLLEMAKKYYPELWNKERIEALVKAKKLTKKQAEEVLGREESK